MKKVHILLLAITAAFASCNGKLPNASITGATPWDYVPYGMMIVGVLFMAYCGIDQLANGQAYTDKKLNPSLKRFVFGWGGFVLLFMGVVIAFS